MANFTFGGLGGGEVGRVKGILKGLLALIEPNCGILGRLVTPRRRILSERSTTGTDLTLSILSGFSSSSAKWTLFGFGSLGKVLLIPNLEVGVVGDETSGTSAGGGGDGVEDAGGAGAGRTGTTLDGNSIVLCKIGFEISMPRKLSRFIFVALMLWLRGNVLASLSETLIASGIGSGLFTIA